MLNEVLTERIITLDFVKVFAIIFIIILHSAAPILYQYGKIDDNFWMIGNIYDSIARMSVPLFFMVTGTLLLNKTIPSTTLFLKKRIGRIVIPLIFWSIIYAYFNIYVMHKDLHLLTEVFYSLFRREYYHLWFLYALIGIYLFIPILNIFITSSSKKMQYYFIILWIFSISIIPIFDNFLNIKAYNYLPMMSGYIGYLVLGYLLSKIVISNRILIVSLIIFCISTLITIYGTSYLTEQSNSYIGFFYSYFSLSTVFQSISVFIILRYIGSTITIKMNNIIIDISKKSLGIYLIHPILLWALTQKGIYALNGSNPLYMIPITALCAFFLSYILISIMYKSKLLKKTIS
jgi:surface polysaccharide O-acyltransferase-like enzyme